MELLMFQYTELDDFLKSRAKEHERSHLKRELGQLMEERERTREMEGR
jgi:hypothetical protein